MISLRTGNPMRVVLMTVLIFEVIVFGLAIPGMILVSDVPPAAAAGSAGGAALLALLAAALLRTRVGYILGWVVQCIGLALGFLNTTMFFVGALFAAVWVMAFVMGKRLDSGMEASPEGGEIP
ncbi:MAG TPA: DUF4233 domain-containing protein [Propionibacteriaceae bacterium]|nr:DUF4233 domain-containing protein [Propionibacteriaceae bacterium]